jgi:hypothetical protein
MAAAYDAVTVEMRHHPRGWFVVRLIDDIPMRVSAGPALLGIEGMPGLDFFEQFAEARFDFQSLRLTLVRA